jgi:hypothetical protein
LVGRRQGAVNHISRRGRSASYHDAGASTVHYIMTQAQEQCVMVKNEDRLSYRKKRVEGRKEGRGREGGRDREERDE